MSIRYNNSMNSKLDIALDIKSMLHLENKYVRKFRMAMEHAHIEDFKVVIHTDRNLIGKHEKHFNAPETCEVTVCCNG